ncbi:structural maintenance of chromosomes protein 6B [Eucalyptus grandis]|uniref:structural maintenance of chromosomes protein 6B n=1 Tax=Eucalyptus grandis TaxID=71139 RepID=UPI00192E8CD0|nr:structural maintenance of chromosomes protein 6B [Eucalyptus grandis]
MCHSSLQIELGDWVNFITGQNGSGKSAILTALCVAFGCRAKGTQRASTLKDFIKTGCSSALVQVDLKNCGEDAFKPEIYGDIITVERRISESTGSMALKDCQGRKVASRKEELRELIEHFNIDVENPCVIMSQDKSREFLHSGNPKDKFKFFFKATLLQQVNDLLQNIREHLDSAKSLIEELEATIEPIKKELNELVDKIKNMELVEEISQEVQQLKKKLAWAWVYDVDRQLKEQSSKIEKLKARIPACQAKIDEQHNILERLRESLTEKKMQIEHLMIKTSEVKKKKSELQQRLSLAKRERHELREEHSRSTNHIQKLIKRVQSLQQQIQEMQEQHLQSTQNEEFELEANVREIQSQIDAVISKLRGLNEDENALSDKIQREMDDMQKITNEIEDLEKKQREVSTNIRELKQHKTNKVTAFGGERVIHLLRVIERHQSKFTRAPIGPIGSHLSLIHGGQWAPAVENSIGRLLNAFIVTNHRDSLVLRGCAKEANYNNLQIIIYDFSRPRLTIPHNMLPQTEHPTTFSVLRADSDTVLNVLVDMGSIERHVLVRDYDEGKKVAFDQNITNLKEVYTLDGYKMFSRGSVQTTLPPNKRARTGRLCGSFDDQIEDLQREAQRMKVQADQCRKRKRDAESSVRHLQDNLQTVKRRCKSVERDLASKKLALEDLKKANVVESSLSTSDVDELHQEISKVQDEIQENETLLEKISLKMSNVDESAHNLKLAFEELCESAKVEIDALEDAERELMKVESTTSSVEAEKTHYEGIMSTKVLSDIQVAEAQHRELEHNRTENCRKASIICQESEIEALGGWDGCTPEQLSTQLNMLKRRLQLESQQYSESIDDLKILHDKKQRKIARKLETYAGLRERLNACETALKLRLDKFQRNATLLKRQLTWQFNAHLAMKGISGQIKVSYEEKTLSVEVRMPQDASSTTVRDTRGLSGGERSFSTLCFALALHEMTEAPFRAMDEFDVFMDAVSRKISLDTLVDFALAHGSQWIFITPHDISMVKHGERIKKQQMAAPRS